MTVYAYRGDQIRFCDQCKFWIHPNGSKGAMHEDRYIEAWGRKLPQILDFGVSHPECSPYRNFRRIKFADGFKHVDFTGVSRD